MIDTERTVTMIDTEGTVTMIDTEGTATVNMIDTEDNVL